MSRTEIPGGSPSHLGHRVRQQFEYAPLGASLLTLVLVVLTAMTVFGFRKTSLGEPEWFHGGSGPLFDLKDAAARMVWGFSGLAMFVALVGLFLLFVWTLYGPPVNCGELRHEGAFRRLAISGASAAALFAAASIVSWARINVAPGNSVFATEILDKAHRHCETSDLLRSIPVIGTGLSLAVFIAGAFAVSALSVEQEPIPSTLPDASDGSVRPEDGGYKIQFGRLRLLLWCSAATLVIAVIQVYLEYRWAAFLMDSGWGEVAMSLAGSLAMGVGGVFTLFLLAIFVPALLLVKKRFDSFTDTVNHGKTAEEVASWKQKIGFSLSLKELYLDLAAVFGPLLAGLVALGGFLRGG